jgi:hypothetical protein
VSIYSLIQNAPNLSDEFKRQFADLKREEIEWAARQEEQWERRMERNREPYDTPTDGRL